MRSIIRATALLAVLLACGPAAAAGDFALDEVASLGAVGLGQLKPKVIAFTDHRKDESSLNTSPAVSPQGDRIAYFSDRRQYTDVYLMSALDGKVMRRVIRGERNGQNGSPFRTIWAAGNERQGNACDIEGFGDFYSVPPPQAGNAPAVASGNGNGSSAATKETADSATKAEFEKFSAYFNLDNGTGKIRGVYMQGNEAVRPIFRKWLQPFRDMGATTLTISNTGGTDHQSFDGVGLPGFQFIQDRIEYGSRTHHSNQDVYDRIQADDMKQAAVIMAAFVYNTTMMDEKLPRKPAAR